MSAYSAVFSPQLGGVTPPQYKSIKAVSIKDAKRQGRVRVRVSNKMNNIDVRRKGDSYSVDHGGSYFVT